MDDEVRLARHLRDRYSRQTMLHAIGEAGQVKLVNGRVTVIGCGALGSNIAALLVRAGVGHVRIVDRDFIEYHNLQRQVLFDEEDVRSGLPKAIAAARHLRKVNASVEIEAVVADVNYTNIEGFCAGADVILDGLDNIETRFLINDVSLKLGIPWVYGGAIMTTGMTATIVPGETPCFRCFSRSAPEPGAMPTCETVGVLGTVPAVIGALQATEAIKLMVDPTRINRDLVVVDAWHGTFEKLKLDKTGDCPACLGRYEFLEDRFDVRVTSLCGQSRAMQIVDTRVGKIDLAALAARIPENTKAALSGYMLSFTAGEFEISVFADGRAIVKGTIYESVARELYNRYVKTAGP